MPQGSVDGSDAAALARAEAAYRAAAAEAGFIAPEFLPSPGPADSPPTGRARRASILSQPTGPTVLTFPRNVFLTYVGYKP